MKKPLQSKTVWVNMMLVAVAAVTGAMNVEVIANNPALVAAFGAVIGIVNIVLRLVTKDPMKI